MTTPVVLLNSIKQVKLERPEHMFENGKENRKERSGRVNSKKSKKLEERKRKPQIGLQET